MLHDPCTLLLWELTCSQYRNIVFRDRYPVCSRLPLLGKILDAWLRSWTNLSQRNHHSVMGMESNPTDHKAVAASIFITVAIYGVSFTAIFGNSADLHAGVSRLLRIPSIPTCSSEQEGRHLLAVDIGVCASMSIMSMQRSSGSGIGTHYKEEDSLVHHRLCN